MEHSPERRIESRDDADAKDALDVLIEHLRAELDRVQRRIDRADLQASGVIAGGLALAGGTATALAALHQHLDATSITFAVVGGVCIAVAILVSLLGRDSRFSGISLVMWFARGLLRLASHSHAASMALTKTINEMSEKDIAPIKAFLGTAVRYGEIAGIENPVLPENATHEQVFAAYRVILGNLRKVIEDRFLDLPLAEEATGLQIRETISASLHLRLYTLDLIAISRVGIARQASIWLAAGMCAVAVSFAVTLA